MYIYIYIYSYIQRYIVLSAWGVFKVSTLLLFLVVFLDSSRAARFKLSFGTDSAQAEMLANDPMMLLRIELLSKHF